MKLKEYPFSFYHTWRLKSISVNGLSKRKPEFLPIVISFTTIRSRLNKVEITVRSILNQSKQPEMVLLWLNENDKNYIPSSLKELEGDVFKIFYTKRTSSHKKLIHTLESYPDKILVTCDDDFIYDNLWLEKIYAEHLKFPNAIIANQTRQIKYNAEGELLDYKFWVNNDKSKVNNVLAIGAAGILYPPKSLPEITINYDLAIELAPKADDLWFKAMALLNNTEVRQSANVPKNLIPIFGTQKISLKKENVDKNMNVLQWESLTKYFNLKLS